MPDTRPSLAGFEQILDLIASDPRLPANLPEWIRASLRTSGWKLQILRHILNHSRAVDCQLSILDVGAQFGSLAIYAAKLGCCAAAVDYGSHANVYREIAADHGVDYRECDLGARPLPFADGAFDFVTYTDVIEHHSFSPKRVLQEIHRLLAPGGQVILLTPNQASIYNRLKLLSGRSIHDDLDYFFDSSAGDAVYDGHHREYTRAEVKAMLQRTGFRVKECRVVEQDLASLVRYLRRNRKESRDLPKSRDLLLCALGGIWAPLHLPFGRWIWAIGEKESR
jgi:2-polyprenyl-3-methyl-5-hydroxy-6-metoxy-1,4-benzoquinol methylase